VNVTITQLSPALSISTQPGQPIAVTLQVTPAVQVSVAVPGSISGPAGLQGPQGEQGPPGQDGSGANTFVYTQVSAASTWHIVHNLSVFPAIVVADSAGTVIEGGIQHHSLDDCTLSFSSPFAGVAYLI
jgi:hypothetical protein